MPQAPSAEQSELNTGFRSPLLSRLTAYTELRKLLRSNEPPTRIQASHCQEIVQSSPGELEQYDAEILRMKTIVDKMEHERALLHHYSRLCRCVLSPIRQLPSEILAEIFSFFSPEIPDWPYGSEEGSEEEELERVANIDLLRISKVCLRWHQLVMGTPSLWSVIGLNMRLLRGIPGAARMSALLESSLKRSGDIPLELGVHIPMLCGDEVLNLLPMLAQHSRRWGKVSLAVDGVDQLRALSTVMGNLPLLTVLELHIEDSTTEDDVVEADVVEATSFFAVAPQLTEFWYCGRLQALPKLPLEQLKTFLYFHMRPSDIDPFISMMSRFLNPEFHCRIMVGLYDDDDDDDVGMATIPLSPVTSRLYRLAIGVSFGADAAREVLFKLMTRLTLPSLFGLRLHWEHNQGIPLPWPHLEFLALADRSSFCDHLVVLEIESVFITELELLQVLSGLPLLEHLSISDHWVVDGKGEELVLVTDSLLQRLIWTSDPACLVPGLSYLETHTLLKFDDAVYSAFVLSRLKPGWNSEGPFEVGIPWYSDFYRELDPGVVAQFRELERQGELLFSCAESPLFPPNAMYS
ncbi:hypothetical protein DFH06DRAFT_1210682 [Mycena polygramma]|nr:hypothetical protein DFH06DRAFT_1210682 [Mycena polygramma]